MNERDAHLRGLASALSRLSWKKQASFGLLAFERLMPGLTAFAQGTGLDISCYLKARDAVWAALGTNSGTKNDGLIDQSLKDKCLGNIPDTERFSHERTSDALNATLTMSEILDFMIDRKPEHITYAASLALDSADSYASSLLSFIFSTPEIERKIATHPAVQEEVLRQTDDIHFLSELPDEFDEQTVEVIKRRATE